MKKIKLDILGLSSRQSQSGSFALVLGEAGGKRRLPIIIGMFEAQAIAIEVERIIPTRPMTHDLFKSFADAFQFRVEEVIISDLKDGVFFAKIISFDGTDKRVIDSRPSDAIAIGLRFNAPIFTSEKILAEAGIEFDDDADFTPTKEPPKPTAKIPTLRRQDDFKNLSIEKLYDMLEEALANENYERAATIRDELNRRN